MNKITQSLKGVVRFSISLPPSLVKDFDGVWRAKGYDNRSRAVHDALRSFISEYKWSFNDTEELVGAIVLIYYLDKPGLLNQIVKIQHIFEDVISSTMHIHLAKNKCLEIIAVRGEAKTIRKLGEKLSTQKGIRELKYAVTAS
ncbi:MAG: nickel-responsive transcriptional regulator NikR [Candidatus Jordarchaeaceae archaeon]